MADFEGVSLDGHMHCFTEPFSADSVKDDFVKNAVE